MAKRSRRTKANVGKMCHCRMCEEDKPELDFYTSTDKLLDSNGRMSICKFCVTEIYDSSYLRNRTLNKTLLDVCRIFNVVYDERVVDSVRKEIDKNIASGRKPKPVFSIYKGRAINMLGRSGKIDNADDHDLTFYEPKSVKMSNEDMELQSHDEFWGEKLPQTSVDFLETEYRNFQKNYKTETYAEIVLLKRVCFKLLALRLAQESENAKAIPALEKSLLGLMKELAISPAHVSASKSGESNESFGMFIKRIEETEPAEWLDIHGKPFYGDMDLDEIEHYYDNFFVRSLRNFITGNADYAILEDLPYVGGEE